MHLLDLLSRMSKDSGVTTRDTYTKAAHFVLLKEMLPPGRMCRNARPAFSTGGW